MRIHADFAKPATVRSAEVPWTRSPIPGVERKMLDRIGGEVARATSIVRYAPGSSFSEHTHEGGEEFIVLEGTFQDEHADYPAGSYVRNPVGTHHTPRSDDGCTIFVKLWQFDGDDRKQFSLDLNALNPAPAENGVARVELHRFASEWDAYEEWSAGTEVALGDPGGVEVLVLRGTIEMKETEYAQHDWLRFPPGEVVSMKAGSDGAKLWIKRGHLHTIKVPQAARAEA